MSAIGAVARVELRRRWRTLVVLGLLAGLAAGTVLSSLALARRTSTAPARLAAASHVDDVRITAFGGASLGDELAALSSFERAWPVGLHVGQVVGPEVAYFGLIAGEDRPDDLFTPVVVQGRAADESRADEAVVTQRLADALDLGPGDVLTLDLLAAEEVAQFDVGFGEPDGPTVDLTITGVVRVAAADDLGPVQATEAFAREQARTRAGVVVMGRLAAPFEELERQLEPYGELAAAPGAEEFPPVQVTRPDPEPESLSASARVLVAGLVVFAAVAAAVGALVVAQALGRSHAAGVEDQRIEAALGLTARQRAVARSLPALVAGGLALVTAAATSLAAAGLDPLGAVHDVEPSPGWSPNVALVSTGSAAVLAVVWVLALLSAWRAGRSSSASTVRPPSTPGVVAARSWSLAGWALLRAQGVSLRSSMVGVVIGVAGATAALSFDATLDRLAGEPARYGWQADFSIIDVTDEGLAQLQADDRVVAVAHVEAAPVPLDGAVVEARSVTDVVGRTGWTMFEGRMPAADDEVALGPAVAERLDVDLGDDVDGLRVVGIGIGPIDAGDVLGEQAVVSRAVLEERGVAQPFAEAWVTVAGGADEEAVTDEYAGSFEVTRDDPPRSVADLIQLGALPQLLAAFLLAVAALALAHTLVATTGRRRRDIAVLRAVGFTPRQAGAAVTAAGAVVVAGAIAVGVPAGLGVGRLVWWFAASGVGVDADLAEPWLPLGALLLGAVVAVVALAAVPARRATTVLPALALRAE